jgi:methyltransferase (TIGR00027 family)
VALWRGVDRFEKSAVVRDPFADLLLPFPYRPMLDIAREVPRATRAVLRVIERLSGGRSRHMALRTRAIDEAVESAVRGGARQVVLLGAGLDARAWRLDALRECTVFEVDFPSTQAFKRARVEGLVPRAKALHFVDVDFESGNLGARLADAGFDASQRTVFVWEAVVMYLTRPAIDATLAVVARIAAQGSTLAMTYFSDRHLPPLAFVLRAVREPLVTMLSPADAAEILRRHGFEVTGDESNPEWSERYLGARIDFPVERLVCATRAPMAAAHA